METTTFGRVLENWETNAGDFINRGGFEPSSSMANAIYRLSQDEFKRLVSQCDPAQDALIHVDSSGFTVNHGNVGTKGIRYEF